MMGGTTLGRYFAGRFMVATIGTFAGILLLMLLIDYIETVRYTSRLVSPPPLLVMEMSVLGSP